MRVLLAIAMLIGGMLALNAPADAARKIQARAGPPCTVRAWPYSPYGLTGEFRGFPCWARKAFSKGRK
jgi:hypothetical protein